MQCNKCGALNLDNAFYCNQCGSYLTNNFDFYTVCTDRNYIPGDTSIKLGYFLSIIFGWGGVLILLLSKLNDGINFIGFIGLFLPFYLI